MQLSYLILVRIDHNGEIYSLKSFDLCMDFYTNDIDLSLMNREQLKDFLAIKISDYLSIFQARGEMVAVPLNKVDPTKKGKDDYFIKICVTCDDSLVALPDKKGCLEKSFPYVGFSINILNQACNEFSYFLSVNKSVKENRSTLGIGISGAISGVFMSLIVFKFSNAAENFSVVGRRISNCISAGTNYINSFFGQQSPADSPVEHSDHQCKKRRSCFSSEVWLKLLIAVPAIYDAALSTLNSYNSMVALGNDVHEQEPDFAISKGVIENIAILAAILAAINQTAINLSFAFQFSDYLFPKLPRFFRCCCKTESHVTATEQVELGESSTLLEHDEKAAL